MEDSRPLFATWNNVFVLDAEMFGRRVAWRNPAFRSFWSPSAARSPTGLPPEALGDPTAATGRGICRHEAQIVGSRE